jgi:gamma-glutamylcyclotransferase (GGCT)/AIG2-like uncharacterized protein YtfP
MMENLPFFVYGTLRTGQYNRDLIADVCTYVETGVVRGAVLHRGPGFPYMYITGDPSDIVIGELTHIDNEHYGDAMSSLDYLEGIASGHYRRVKVEVDTEAMGAVICWAYVAGNHASRLVEQGVYPRITSGDWCNGSD